MDKVLAAGVLLRQGNKSRENDMRTRNRKSQLDNSSIMKLENLPKDWIWNESAGGPPGWCWANNGKSRFKPGFKHALVKMPA